MFFVIVMYFGHYYPVFLVLYVVTCKGSQTDKEVSMEQCRGIRLTCHDVQYYQCINYHDIIFHIVIMI